MCCVVSLRGAAYFGASIHLCMGFIQMGRFIDFCIVLFTNSKITHTLEYCLVTLANLLYSALRLPLSSLIFIGIEKNCIILLTWPPIFHFLMQIFGFMVRIKYGLMIIQPCRISATRTISWVKEEFVMPDSIEKLVEDTLFGFIFTTFHLLIIFFLVQNIETSVQGQVLDPNPGLDPVQFLPHHIQPPRWFSRFRPSSSSSRNSNRRNLVLQIQAPNSFISSTSTRNENHYNNIFSRTSETRHLNDEPPPYYYASASSNENIPGSSSSSFRLEQTLETSQINYQESLENETDNNEDTNSTCQELMVPLLPL